MELFQANKQWSTRADEERFTSLIDMHKHFETLRARSRELVAVSTKLEARPTEDNKGLLLYGPNGTGYAPTHWAFGQIAQRAEAPAGYLRTLPAPIAADAINYGLQFKRGIDEVGVLLHKTEDNVGTVRAVTGPKYGRIWNKEVTKALIERFGNGVTGRFRVPGEWGKEIVVTKANTTMYASDEDMFVFLADEKNRVVVPNRRDGKAGSLARGFFAWNSEVGSKTFGLGTFLYDEVCGNRIVWGAQGYEEIKLRHTVSAPERFIEEVAPALEKYAESSTASITEALETARNARLGDKLDDFLANRFGPRVGEKIKLAHLADEGRPMENLWDVVVGATAYARNIPFQGERVELERKAGLILG